MKNFTQFIKTTILGGLIFLVPLVVVTVVLAKAHEVMAKVAKPFSALIPLDTVGGVAIANLLAILAILLCCLIVGMIAKGDAAKRLLKSTEEKLLVIPAYAFIKGVTDSLISSEEAAKAFVPVIVKFDDNAQMAFEIERSEGGNVVTRAKIIALAAELDSLVLQERRSAMISTSPPMLSSGYFSQFQGGCGAL